MHAIGNRGAMLQTAIPREKYNRASPKVLVSVGCSTLGTWDSSENNTSRVYIHTWLVPFKPSRGFQAVESSAKHRFSIWQRAEKRKGCVPPSFHRDSPSSSSSPSQFHRFPRHSAVTRLFVSSLPVLPAVPAFFPRLLSLMPLSSFVLRVSSASGSPLMRIPTGCNRIFRGYRTDYRVHVPLSLFFRHVFFATRFLFFSEISKARPWSFCRVFVGFLEDRRVVGDLEKNVKGETKMDLKFGKFGEGL